MLSLRRACAPPAVAIRLASRPLSALSLTAACRSTCSPSLTSAPARPLHATASPLNGINLTSMGRNTGPGQTEKIMHKRMTDRLHEQEAAQLPKAFPNEQDFHAQVMQTYGLVERGLGDMLAANPAMRIVKDPATPGELEVALGPDRGSFMFSVDTPAQRMVMFTPQSAATYRYRWDTVQGRWVADCDGHQLEEMFVRDIISTGLLSFPQL